MKRLALLFACVALAASAQEAAPDPWKSARFLLGRWQGSVQGDAGTGTVTRTYELTLGGGFIEERSVSTYPMRDKTRKGEVHEHRGFVSYDRKRQKLMLRQFDQEGTVRNFALTSGSGSQMVFDSLENPDLGRSRVTWEIYSSDEFIETFEQAAPGKTYEVFSRARLTRVGRATGE